MSLLNICKDHGISVLSCPPEQWDRLGLHCGPSTCTGKAILMEDKPYILYDGNCSHEEICYTIAHELGHILLGHLSFRGKSGDYAPYMETEANIFAAVLLARDLYDSEQKSMA